MFRGGLRPGQGFQWFTVHACENGIADNGRPGTKRYVESGQIAAILMVASQGDVQQWRGKDELKQDAHPVLYKIIQQGTANRAKPTDYLVLGERRFRIKGVHDPGGLGHFTVYFAEERKDLQ